MKACNNGFIADFESIRSSPPSQSIGIATVVVESVNENENVEKLGMKDAKKKKIKK